MALPSLFKLGHQAPKPKSSSPPSNQPNMSSTSQKQRQLPRIPFELYRTIFQYVDTQDLSSLCLVSRAAGGEAQYLLYRNVDLHAHGEKNVTSWAITVSRSAHLANMLHSLCISSTQGTNNTSSMVGTRTALTNALRKTTNLSEFIAREHPRLSDKGRLHDLNSNLIDLSVLDECIAHLRVFRTEGHVTLIGRRAVDFYTKCPNLREWTADSAIVRGESLRTDILPNLSVVNIRLFSSSDRKLLKFIASRPIERVNIDIAEFLMKSDALDVPCILQQASRTLTHLRLESDGYSSLSIYSQLWTSLNIVECMAGRLQALKVLCVISSHRSVLRHGCGKAALVNALCKFRNLETFITNTLQCNVKGCTTCSSWNGLKTPQSCFEAAEELISSNPSLCHIAFQTGGRGSAWICFRRAKSGGVLFEGINVVNDSAWYEV